MEPDELNLWVREIHKDNLAMGFKVEKTLFTGRSEFQKIDIVQTAGHGAMLLNDGLIMLSERDEFIYHEMIAHVPLFVHPAPKKVLVIGGGDGGSVREIVKHSNVESVVMVEIDELVVSACRDHMPSVSCEMANPRLYLIIDDGIEYVRTTTETFDVVIVDSTDPVGPGVALFEPPFYENVSRILLPDGIMITQAESPFYDSDFQQSMFNNQRPFFQRLHMYLFPTQMYPGGLWSFGFASKGPGPLTDFDADHVRQSGLSFKYYNPGIHRAAFMLPGFVKDNMAEVLDPLDEAIS